MLLPGRTKLAQARKPDFDAFIAPQRSEADVVIQVLPTQLIPGDTEGKILRTRMVQKEGLDFFDPAFLFDEGSTISWVPCGRKLTCSFPGIKFAYGPDTYYDNEVSVIEMDGQFDNLQVCWCTYALRLFSGALFAIASATVVVAEHPATWVYLPPLCILRCLTIDAPSADNNFVPDNISIRLGTLSNPTCCYPVQHCP